MTKNYKTVCNEFFLKNILNFHMQAITNFV